MATILLRINAKSHSGRPNAASCLPGRKMRAPDRHRLQRLLQGRSRHAFDIRMIEICSKMISAVVLGRVGALHGFP
jgi:hypothetical protein